jgi:circadian clock protein KaiC
MPSTSTRLRRISTGISGLDDILFGGLPELSINIVTGRPGTGKTVLTHQAIFANLGPDQRALYLTTLSEPGMKMLRYMQNFSFVDAKKMGQELTYVDIGEVIQEQALAGTISYILELVRAQKPAIVAIDSFKAVHDLAENHTEIRKFGFDLAVNLTTWGVTTFLIGEYVDSAIQEEPIFAIADSILCLRYEPSGLHYQRFLDVAKLRGSEYFEGRHPYTITEGGLTVYPRIRTPDITPVYTHSEQRQRSGLSELDEMLGGGLPVGTATMVAGGAGTGKTLLGSHFVVAAAARGERSVIVSFQENPVQLNSISRGFGWNFDELKSQQLMTHLYHSPVELQPDIHFSKVREAVDRSGAKLVLIDSLKDIEIATPDKIRYKDYIYSLISELKLRGVTTIVTNEIPELFGPFQLSEFGISFIADNVILLRYVELLGKMSRAINVMKVRGSQHSKEFREFEITSNGARILQPIRAFTGILTGTPTLNQQALFSGLPPRPRFLMEVLKQSGASDIAGLADVTGLRREAVTADLQWLRDHGWVAAIHDQGRELLAPAL